MQALKTFLKKNWVWLLVAAAVILLGKKLMKAFTPGGIFSEGDNKVREDQMKEDLKNTKVEQAKMSKSLQAINQIADALYNAMDDFGTDADRIFSELQSLNTEDLKALYKSFGIREETIFGGIVLKRGNLFDWFQDELSSGDFDKVKQLFSKTGLI